MPRLIVTEGAILGLERCSRFLIAKDRRVAERAGRVIEQQFALLELNAAIGRPSSDSLDLRELVIPFGNAGYVALYRHDSADDVIYVLAFRHQREAGY